MWTKLKAKSQVIEISTVNVAMSVSMLDAEKFLGTGGGGSVSEERKYNYDNETNKLYSRKLINF